MQKVRVDLGERSYNILIGNGSLEEIGRELEKFEFSRKLALVSNPTVYGIYGERVADSLTASGFELDVITIPDGEEYKDLAWVQKIYDELLGFRLDRRSALIALGGGVVGDITGFAASTYMRGIDFVQIPTTLLAQVDSSVGGKTGVNHKLGKNMIGTFWQPRLVWIDADSLRTLPRRQFLSGLAEVIKYGVIWDEEFFAFLERERENILSLERSSLEHVIKRSCEIKAEVVSRDEREAGLRAILNYGHTMGHAIETATGYRKYLHGEAVAVGMHIEARLSRALGFIDEEKVIRLREVIESYGLPSQTETDFTDLIGSMRLDKKAVSGELVFVLPEKIGTVRIQRGVSAESVREVLAGR